SGRSNRPIPTHRCHGPARRCSAKPGPGHAFYGPDPHWLSHSGPAIGRGSARRITLQDNTLKGSPRGRGSPSPLAQRGRPCPLAHAPGEVAIMYLSRISISNFRNFSELDVSLNGNVVVVGENRVGKSNLLYALRLIFDPSLPDSARQLGLSDFWDGLGE